MSLPASPARTCQHCGVATRVAIQDLYPEDFSHCYGCGRYNTAGYQIKTYLAGATTVTEFEPATYHTGGADYVYGGLIASVIDCHSTGSAALLWMSANGMEIGPGPAVRFVTAHLEVDYLAPTPLSPMHVTGSAEEIGERKVVVASNVVVDGNVTATGRAVLVKPPAG